MNTSTNSPLLASHHKFHYFSQNSFPMKLPLARVIVIIAVAGWCTGIILPPLAVLGGGALRAIAPGVYSFYSMICHQIDARSFHLFGIKFAVCARCTGIYAGFLAGAILSLFGPKEHSRPDLWWVVGLIPMVADVVLDITGLHQSSIFFRVTTGGFFGIVAALLIFPLLTEALAYPVVSSTNYPGVPHESET
jgi:uncharacterized membrane protein